MFQLKLGRGVIFHLTLLLAISSALARADVREPNRADALRTKESDVIDSWRQMVKRTREAQPKWITPLVTGTPRLEQEFRVDNFSTSQAGGSHLNNFGGGKGLEIIPTYNTEVILGIPPHDDLRAANGKNVQGWGDWPALVVKYRLLTANKAEGDYIVTAYVQTSVPTGATGLSNELYIVQPTLGIGKGWGNFDVQATFSDQIPVASKGPPGTSAAFGDPLAANVALQYHAFQYFWPELEVNDTYWPNGKREGLSQVLLTPGLVIGRIALSDDMNLIVGGGYQIATTPNPLVNRNTVLTGRVTF